MRIFFVGIKGVGMTSLATLYKEWGHEVMGSDTHEEFFTDHILSKLGIPVESFEPDHITEDLDKVIYSSAYNASNPQLVRARELNISCLSYAEALRDIFNEKKGILVTGTHGKTTSAAMLGRVLEEAGLDPTVVAGGEILEWGKTARAGKSDWIVSEGDEYQAKILMLKPHVLLLNNIEYDHPDFYKDEDAYKQTFASMLASMPDDGLVVANEVLKDFVEKHTKAKKIFFGIAGKERLSLKLWGDHNQANARGVLEVAKAIGIDEKVALKALGEFRGTRRRMELYTKEDADVVIIDDYAHHPTEIRATLQALREHYSGRTIVAAFQPHTYSRTEALFDDFTQAFAEADVVVILDIYASAREAQGKLSGKDLFDGVSKNHSNVIFASDIQDAEEKIKTILRPNSVLVCLGAGDTWKIAKALSQ